MAKRKKRPGRGWPSSIDRLPEDVRVGINADLRTKALTQKDILEQANAILAKRGEKPISSSAMNRYAMALEDKGSMMREAREAANALVGGLGEQGGTDLGRSVTEMVKTLTFDLMMRSGDGEDGESAPIGVDTLNKVALIAQRIERASKISLDREIKIREEARKQALEEAADSVKKTAGGSIPEKTLNKIMEEIYGLSAG